MPDQDSKPLRFAHFAPSADAPPETVDRMLFARLAQRDVSVMVEVYRRFSTPLYSYALRMLRNEGDAEEVLQDTFVRAWDKASQFEAKRAEPFTWLVMILRGLCIDRLRKRSSQKRRGTHVPLEDVPENRVSAGDGLESLFLAERIQRVRRALQRLDPIERRFIEMAVFGEVTHAEIAIKVNAPLGTVKSRIRRGMIKLRNILNSSDYEEE